MVPVTSLCPCSKKISDYGAHNQRSHVTITATIKDFIWIEEIIDIVESEASSELYGLLKDLMKSLLLRELMITLNLLKIW
jgi:GTP cyclohydrolase I